MFDYKPERSNEVLPYDQIGSVSTDFEPFKPNPKYGWGKGIRVLPKGHTKDNWKLIVPKTAPKIGRLPQVIEDVLKMTWKFSEPTAGAQRGNVFAATHRGNVPVNLKTQTYHPQVRPVKPAISSTFPNNSAIASDWKVFEQIERTNGVTFRGDSRPPQDVINTYGGFTTPDSRTDRYYLEEGIYPKFADYLDRRFQRPLSKNDFLKAVDSALPNDADKKILIDYMMWRKIVEKEKMHLGRMVEHECLKGYISTSRAIETAIQFGTRHNAQMGWVYLTIVHAGFIVPWSNANLWGSGEAEIAQWGPIPSERIVGFARFTQKGLLDSDIYIRRSFRKREPEAFEKTFKIFSGKTPY